MQNKDLLTLLPDSQKVVVGEDEFVISPFKWGQFRKVAEITKTLSILTTGEGEETQLDIIGIVATNGVEISKIIALSTDKSVEWVDGLELGNVVELATAIFVVNRDFFSQRLLPLMQKATESLSGGLK